jgi:hypothetical protein
MTNENSKTMTRVGWVLSAIPILMMGLLPIVYITTRQQEVIASMQKYGYPDKYAFGIFFAEMACAWIYAIPRTSMFGAILLTGYLGGAVATHVHADELPNLIGPVLFAVLAWLGLFLRDARLRALVPLRR